VDELLEDLNPPQVEAVLHGNGPLLVLAGAGSGKTRVITRRIAHLVMRRNVPPWRILAVTFTNKAAREMRERLEKLLGTFAQGLTVSTFHSSAALILRREAEAAGLSRNFLIYDDSDQMALARRAIRESGVEVSSVTPRDVLSRIDAEKNAGRTPDQMQPGTDAKAQTLQRIYRKYQSLLKAANALDFGDLLLHLVELLRTNEEVRLKYQRRFEHVLVDEFQDTNPVQYQLLELLAPKAPVPANLVVVGDDDQSIYRWRGANVDNILGFDREYPGAKVVKLEQNYRSDQTILEAAHAVIAQNRRRMAKKLWSGRAKGEPLGLIVARDERGEAQQVAGQIHDLRMKGIADYDQMAVFYRTNAQSRVIEETFRLMRVPYTLVSGRSFYDRAEIKDASSYLRLMVNPHSDADLLRVVNVPARGIGDTTTERLQDWAANNGVSLYEAIAAPEQVHGLGSAAIKRLTGFRELVDRLVVFARKSPDAETATRYMLEQTGLVAAHMQEGSEESIGRAENLKELLTATQEFDRQRVERGYTPQVLEDAAGVVEEELEPSDAAEPEGEVDLGFPSQGDLFSAAAPAPKVARVVAAAPVAAPEPVAPRVVVAPVPADEQPLALDVEAPPLQAFLEQVSLVGDADGETGEARQRVSVMTLHAAKGLEFDAVFMTGMEEEVFPHRRATAPEASEEEMAEERRLCYVGFTRARRRLTCSLAQSRALFGELRFNPPSRFLAEVPKELFGFVEPPEPERTVVAQAPFVRRAAQDEGPVIDRSYDQSSDFSQVEGDLRGARVSHQRFGPGVVLSVNGRGPNAKLRVKFASGELTVVARFLQPG
jgi:DNA helicase-2/ATP-dependent DNA helicase PcrA